MPRRVSGFRIGAEDDRVHEQWTNLFWAAVPKHADAHRALLKLLPRCCNNALSNRLFNVAYPEVDLSSFANYQAEDIDSANVAVDKALKSLKDSESSLKTIPFGADCIDRYDSALEKYIAQIKEIRAYVERMKSELPRSYSKLGWGARAKWRLYSYVEAAMGRRHEADLEHLVFLAFEVAGKRLPEKGTLKREMNRYRTHLEAWERNIFEWQRRYYARHCTCDLCFSGHTAECQCDFAEFHHDESAPFAMSYFWPGSSTQAPPPDESRREAALREFFRRRRLFQSTAL